MARQRARQQHLDERNRQRGAGETAGLFSLQFDWLDGNSIPGQPRFEVYRLDPSFEVIQSGFASLVPAAALLFGSGLAGLLLLVRRRA